MADMALAVKNKMSGEQVRVDFRGMKGEVAFVKHKRHIPEGKRATCVVTPKDQMADKHQPTTRADAMMESIHTRADYVGPVLEEILQASHARVNW